MEFKLELGCAQAMTRKPKLNYPNYILNEHEFDKFYFEYLNAHMGSELYMKFPDKVLYGKLSSTWAITEPKYNYLGEKMESKLGLVLRSVLPMPIT